MNRKFVSGEDTDQDLDLVKSLSIHTDICISFGGKRYDMFFVISQCYL